VISKGEKRPRHGSASGRPAAEKRPLGSVLAKEKRLAELAKKYADSPLSALSHHIDLIWLHEAFRRLNRNSVTSVDGQSVAAYGERLEEKLRDLLERAESGTFRTPSVKRGHSPKDGKELRPIGIPTTKKRCWSKLSQCCWSQSTSNASTTAPMASEPDVLPTSARDNSRALVGRKGVFRHLYTSAQNRAKVKDRDLEAKGEARSGTKPRIPRGEKREIREAVKMGAASN
jgi:plasmid stabilization system protein ParE